MMSWKVKVTISEYLGNILLTLQEVEPTQSSLFSLPWSVTSNTIILDTTCINYLLVDR